MELLSTPQRSLLPDSELAGGLGCLCAAGVARAGIHRRHSTGTRRSAAQRFAARTFMLGVLAAGAGYGGNAAASDLSCHLKFTMTGWSAIYKTATGSGTVTCTNGTTMKVTLESKGLGLTAGKSTIDDGKGVITGAKQISDVLGSYAAADASAAAVKAGAATVLTKGEVSLALSGTGRGWELGVSLSDFTIKR